jgi:hypothetical protein
MNLNISLSGRSNHLLVGREEEATTNAMEENAY